MTATIGTTTATRTTVTHWGDELDLCALLARHGLGPDVNTRESLAHAVQRFQLRYWLPRHGGAACVRTLYLLRHHPAPPTARNREDVDRLLAEGGFAAIKVARNLKDGTGVAKRVETARQGRQWHDNDGKATPRPADVLVWRTGLDWGSAFETICRRESPQPCVVLVIEQHGRDLVPAVRRYRDMDGVPVAECLGWWRPRAGLWSSTAVETWRARATRVQPQAGEGAANDNASGKGGEPSW